MFAQQTSQSLQENIASAGNQTRINCLEGSYADHYTTDAVPIVLLPKSKVYGQILPVHGISMSALCTVCDVHISELRSTHVDHARAHSGQ